MTIVFDQRRGKGFVEMKERGKGSAMRPAGHVMQRAPDVAVSCEQLASRETLILKRWARSGLADLISISRQIQIDARRRWLVSHRIELLLSSTQKAKAVVRPL